MKAIRFIVILLLLSNCTDKKPTVVAADTLNASNASSQIEVQNQDSSITSGEIETVEVVDSTSATITLQNNYVLYDLAPFPLDLTLDSLAIDLRLKDVEVEFESQENGSLVFEGCEIIYNQSYGQVLCNIDVTSPWLPLKKGIKIGMSREAFFEAIKMPFSLSNQNIRYQYVSEQGEHTYTLQFDFRKTLFRFQYLKDPCVIYD